MRRSDADYVDGTQSAFDAAAASDAARIAAAAAAAALLSTAEEAIAAATVVGVLDALPVDATAWVGKLLRVKTAAGEPTVVYLGVINSGEGAEWVALGQSS